MKVGIDVSEHQGIIDWKTAKNFVDFVIIRAGYGSGHVDKQFKNNVSACISNNIPYGIYWFSYAENADVARNEAICCMATIKNLKPTLPIFFDFEDASYNYAVKRNNNVEPNKIAKAFINSLKNNGFNAGLYSNLNDLNRWFGSIKNEQPLWFASWGASSPQVNCDIWQRTDKGTIQGITGYVDLNVAYTDFGNAKTTETDNDYFHSEWLKQEERYKKIVTEILAGAWGNGNARVHNLSAAGYDPLLAQSLVNAELKGN